MAKKSFGAGIVRGRNRTRTSSKIILVTAPVLGSLVSGEAISSKYTPGIYYSNQGGDITQSSVFIVNQIPVASNYIVSTGQTVRVSVTVADTFGNSAIFSTDTILSTGTQPAPTFSTQPTLSGVSFTIGQTVTLTMGVAAPNATLTIEAFTLGGVDKTGELSGLTWDSTGEAAGAISFRVRAVNSTGFTLSNIIGATLNAVASVAPVISAGSIVSNSLSYTVSKASTLRYLVNSSATQLTAAIIKSQVLAASPAVFGTIAVVSGPNVTSANLAPLANGDWYIHAMAEDAGTLTGVATPIGFSKAVSATAPTLTSPTATQTGATTATGTISTNEANGVLYRVLTTSATSPSAAQIKLGQNHTGASAAASGNAAVTATGVQNVTYTGLTASTTYYAYYMHENAGALQSNVSAAASITTAAGGGNPELLPDANLDSAAAWSVPSGFVFSGGNVNIDTTALGNFLRLQNDISGQRAAVTPSVGHTVKATLNSVTTAGRVRIIVEEYTAAFNASGGTTSTTTLYDTDIDGAITAGTITKTFTTAATTNSVSYIFEATVPTLVAQLASLSLKVT